MKITTVLLGLAAVAGTANAGLFDETESNNTLATANSVGSFGFPGGSILVSGEITSDDVDWFSFDLNNAATLTFFAAFSGTPGADAVLQVVGSDGVVIAFDDDSLGLLPSIQLTDLAAGTYFVGLSGFGDANAASVGTGDVFDGLTSTGAGHGEEFVYKLTIGASVVPTPASVAMLGLGGLVMTRRRR